ncbi:MAG: DUF1257 domain-containing protein [Myxococcales bacterium]|nr:DUF1257 domain-containing protein [Myxococcales bacterium]
MSHFTTVKTKLKDLTCIKSAVEDLGLTFTEAQEGLKVRGYQGDSRMAKMVIKASNSYDIGLYQTENGYEMVADWWGIEVETGLKEEAWVERFNQRYAYNKVIKEIKSRGFTLEEEVEEEGEIKMVVRKWS